jgi:uncharacterized protein (DUF305 family)
VTAVLVLFAACAPKGEGPVSTPGAPVAKPSQVDSATRADTTGLEALYRARTDSARMRFIPADASFVTDMIGHHAQAIVMARMAPTHGASSQVKTLAARIINAQEGEIGLMQQWLKDRAQPVPEIMYMGNDIMMHGIDHEMNMMPGMLTPAQMAELDRARGAQFDRAFLTFMIQHHSGAVAMVEKLFATDGAAQERSVFKLASDVQVDQRTEIARMEQMLSAMPGR